MFIRLALKSLFNRKGSVVLTIMAILVSTFVLLGVEHIRHQAKNSFSNTVSGVDLIVGARTGSLNLLLYSVFKLGNPTNNINWDSYQAITQDQSIRWSAPFSLGDSHRGYRVMGTDQSYFQYFSYGEKTPLAFSQGQTFDNIFDVVLGYEVAQQLNYQLGDQLVIAHGMGDTSFKQHDTTPFTVTGILAATGTPVDQTLHVSLAGIEAMHRSPRQQQEILRRIARGDQDIATSLIPTSITGFLVGLESRLRIFNVQRQINNSSLEPMTAILPGVALAELWDMMGMMENILRLISLLVLTAALLGLSAMLLTSVRERRQEINLLRSIGASPGFLFCLIELEAVLISAVSLLLGASLLFAVLNASQSFLASEYGLFISTDIWTQSNMLLALVLLFATALAAIIPSLAAYRRGQAAQVSH